MTSIFILGWVIGLGTGIVGVFAFQKMKGFADFLIKHYKK